MSNEAQKPASCQTAVSTSTFMKEKRGYKRELLGTRYDGWREQTEYKWQYIWSDGTKSIKYTYR